MKMVSVFIPNYINRHYIGCAIQSVYQTFTDYEIIVDDGTTNDVVNSFGDKVRYI